MQLVLDIFLFLIYLSLFLLMCAYVWRFWLLYINQKYLSNIKWVMLEIKIPREVFKSPEAMEIVFNAFLQGGGVGTWYNRNFEGKLPAFFSLEIESDQGEIHFYIRTESKFKQLIQNNLYSQYPGIEVLDRGDFDYTTRIMYEHRAETVDIWGITFKLGNPFNITKTKDREDALSGVLDKIKDEKAKKDEEKKLLKLQGDFLPIRTYIDFKQDKDPKEEYEHDPITPILEWLGSLRKGEYGWYQMLVQDTGKWDGKVFPKTYHLGATHEEFTLAELAKERLEQIRTGETEIKKAGSEVVDEYGNVKMIDNPEYVRNADGTDNGKPKKIALTYGKDVVVTKSKIGGEINLKEEDKIEIKRIVAKMQKPLLRTIMRVAYLKNSKESKGDFGQNVQSTLSLFKHFSYPSYNGFAPTPIGAMYNYDWEDTFKRRKPWRKEEFFEAYVEREGFYPHMEDRKNLDYWLDISLFNGNLALRKKIKMLYEAFFDPFGHPHPEDVFTLNLEELATLYHLPGSVATTPGLHRIDSTKVDAPSNLPL